MDAKTFVQKILEGDLEQNWQTILAQQNEKGHLPEGIHTFLWSMERADRLQFLVNLQASLLAKFPWLPPINFSPMETSKPVRT